MNKKYTEQELNALVSEIETQFSSHLAKAEDTATTTELEKAEKIAKCGEMAKDEEESKEEKKDEDKKEDEKDEEKQEDPKKEDEKPAFMEKSDYSEDDKSELKELYTGMSKSERETHYEAIKTVMASDVAAEPAKTEEKPVEMKKSEQNNEIEALKKSNEELKASMETLVAAMKSKVKTAPKGKAVTGLSALDKSEKPAAPAMSREEAKKVLSKKAAGPLEKSERELINAFCYGQVGLEKVQHLLN